MAVGRPGVPSWNDAAGGEPDQRSGDPAVAGGPAEPAAGWSTGPEQEMQWEMAGPVGGSSRIQAALSRLLAYGLWGGIALALVLGLVNCAGPRDATVGPAPAADPAPPVPPPGGCAELVVSAWLAGDTALLAGVEGVPRDGAEPGRRQATRTYTAGATPSAATGGSEAWGYLVGADVQVLDEQAHQWRPAGRQFFAVTMVRAASGGCQGWRPAALPAQVPAPQLAGEADQPSGYEVTLPDSGTELTGTLQAFFAGMLTGTGGLERYVAPGVVIRPLSPPPYQQVTVTELRARAEPAQPVPPDGTLLQLLATVTTDREDLPLVYPVTVGVRGGRWEVVALDPLVGGAAAAAGPVATAPATGAPGRTNGD